METIAQSPELFASERDILSLLDATTRYEELPTHFIAALLGRTYNPYFYSVTFTKLAKRGDIITFKSNVSKISKHATHAGLGAGFSKNDRPHRLLQNMVKASIELGVKADDSFRLEDWHSIANAMDKKGNFIVPKATLDLIARNKSPHRIEVKDGHVLPDGRPFLLHHGNRHLYVLGFEIDRATEPLTTTQERRNIAEKFRHYKELFEKRLFKTHYGFDNSVVLWVTVTESRMNSMMRLWHDEYGPCSYMTFTTWKDWFYEPRFPKTELDTMFTRGHLRVGKPALHLNKFWES